MTLLFAAAASRTALDAAAPYVAFLTTDGEERRVSAAASGEDYAWVYRRVPDARIIVDGELDGRQIQWMLDSLRMPFNCKDAADVLFTSDALQAMEYYYSGNAIAAGPFIDAMCDARALRVAWKKVGGSVTSQGSNDWPSIATSFECPRLLEQIVLFSQRAVDPGKRLLVLMLEVEGSNGAVAAAGCRFALEVEQSFAARPAVFARWISKQHFVVVHAEHGVADLTKPAQNYIMHFNELCSARFGNAPSLKASLSYALLDVPPSLDEGWGLSALLEVCSLKRAPRYSLKALGS